MRKKNAFRQGDIIFREIPAIPKTAKKVGDTLSESGETGNAHVMQGVTVFEPRRVKTQVEVEMPLQKYVEVGKGGALIKHPEHPDLLIAPGRYLVSRLRTFTFSKVRAAVD